MASDVAEIARIERDGWDGPDASTVESHYRYRSRKWDRRWVSVEMELFGPSALTVEELMDQVSRST